MNTRHMSRLQAFLLESIESQCFLLLNDGIGLFDIFISSSVTFDR